MFFQQKRLSVTVNPYEPPSFFSPDLVTPIAYSPELATPSASSPPQQLPARSSPSRISGEFRPARMRPKSYGGALTPGTLELVLDFESRIAELESRHNRVSVELEETRDTLNNERAERRSSRRFSTLSHARFSSVSSSTYGSDGQGSDQNDADYERRLREELQDTLKKIRAQNTTLSRSLQEKEEACAFLTSTLEAERSARKAAEDEMARLTAANSILFEHNKLLAGRDAALQEDISSLLNKSEVDGWMRGVLEAELRRRGPATDCTCTPQHSPKLDRSVPGNTSEQQGALRAELGSVRDELVFTQGRLSTTEKECAALNGRVSALQKQLVMCLDSSSQALEVERELRADIEQRAQSLVDKNAALKGRLASLEELLFNGQAPDDWLKLSSDKEAKRRPVSGRLQKRLDTTVKTVSLDRVADRHRHVLTARKLREHRKRRLTLAKASKGQLAASIKPQPFVIPKLVSRSPDTPVSQASTCSTKVASPSVSLQLASKGSNRMSVILAATLFKNSRPAQSTLKTNSSLFVDVGSRIDEPMTELDRPASTVAPIPRKPPRNLRMFMMNRASTLFVDLAKPFPPVEESYDELFV